MPNRTRRSNEIEAPRRGISPKARKLLSIFAASSIAICLLCLSFRKIEWDSFLDAVASCDWFFLLLSALTGAMMPLCRSLRWRLTVQPFYPAVRVSDSVLSNYVGYLVNMAVPFTHEATRCVIMHRRTKGGASYDKLLGVALVERACDVVCVLLLFIVTAIISGGKLIKLLRIGLFTGEAPVSWINTVFVVAVTCMAL